MFKFLRLMRAMQEEEGQTLVEYALLLALIAIVVIAVLILLGQEVCTAFNEVQSAISGS
jgi:pilus assembly protein Flp/PilA